MGLVFDIKHYAIHDGPGIRTTVFMKGCPLDCPWCHNPESKSNQPEFMWNSTRCIGCNSCMEVCPKGAVRLSERLEVNESLCTLCLRCIDVCYSGALELVGHEMTVDAVMEEIMKDRVFHKESGGGVTFSGGEPLGQPQFLKQLLDVCQNLDIHTAVDTCGYAESRVITEMMGSVDLWLYDLKHLDQEKHTDTIGVSNQQILKNLKLLKCENVSIRLPLIPGFNDDSINLHATGLFLQENGFTDVCLLPYHTAGSDKRERLYTQQSIFNAVPPDEEKLKWAVELLEEYGLTVKIGG